jgi:general secretion pathway protein D
VFQENSSVASNSNNGPTTNKNSLETTVVADDGQIMVLGGQLKENYEGSTDKVPMLGDLPGVGGLFRTEGRRRIKTVLLVFLRPVVLRDAQSARALTLDRYEAIRAEQQAAQPASNRLMPVDAGPLLPPMPQPGQAVPAVRIPSVAPATPGTSTTSAPKH